MLDPSTIISTDDFETAKRGSYRGIADDGPEGEFRPVMAPANAGNDAYARLVTAVQNGEIGLDDVIDVNQIAFNPNKVNVSSRAGFRESTTNCWSIA